MHWKEKGPEACTGNVSSSSSRRETSSRLHSLHRLRYNQQLSLCHKRYIPHQTTFATHRCTNRSRAVNFNVFRFNVYF